MSNVAVKTIGLFEKDTAIRYVSEDIAVVDNLVVLRNPGPPDWHKVGKVLRMVGMTLVGEPTIREDGLWQQEVKEAI